MFQIQLGTVSSANNLGTKLAVYHNGPTASWVLGATHRNDDMLQQIYTVLFENSLQYVLRQQMQITKDA